MSIVQPPYVGYDDWQRTVAYDGTPFVNETGIDPTTSPVFGPFTVSAWWGINFSSWADQGDYESNTFATFKWGSSTTSGSDLGSLVIVPPTIGFVENSNVGYYGVVIPNRGPYLAISVSCSPGENGPPIYLEVTPTNRMSSPGTGQLDATYAGIGPENVAEDDNLTISPDGEIPTWFGPATIAYGSAGQGNLQLNISTPAGLTTLTLDTFDAEYKTLNLHLPVNWYSLVVNNTDDKSNSMYLTAVAAPPGYF